MRSGEGAGAGGLDSAGTSTVAAKTLLKLAVSIGDDQRVEMGMAWAFDTVESDAAELLLVMAAGASPLGDALRAADTRGLDAEKVVAEARDAAELLLGMDARGAAGDVAACAPTVGTLHRVSPVTVCL